MLDKLSRWAHGRTSRPSVQPGATLTGVSEEASHGARHLGCGLSRAGVIRFAPLGPTLVLNVATISLRVKGLRSCLSPGPSSTVGRHPATAGSGPRRLAHPQEDDFERQPQPFTRVVNDRPRGRKVRSRTLQHSSRRQRAKDQAASCPQERQGKLYVQAPQSNAV